RSDLQKGLGVTACGRQTASKANAIQRRLISASALKHEQAHEVMNQEVQADFPFEVLRGFTAQPVHLESGFDVEQSLFHTPATIVELAQSVRWIFSRVEQSGYQNNLSRA